MEIIKPHNKISRPVESWEQIKLEVEELKKFILACKFRGKHKSCYAIHHAQVSWTPYNFFVVSLNHVLGERALFDRTVIINPVLISGEQEQEVFEGCMSFPFKRHPKKVKRFNDIIVDYYDEWGEAHRDHCMGIKAQIFQHEIDHGLGKNIYFKE